MRVLKVMCCAAALTVALAPGARADEWNKKTILTFSGPVQIPGATLPAGSYVFKLADIPGNRHVVQVFDKDEKKIYTTMLAVPNDRMEPSDEPVVLFAERASGSPQAVKAWFYPGDRIGNEFVYPKTQAMRIAKETHQSVLATNDDSTSAGTAGEIPNAMKNAELGHFTETGTWQSDNRSVAVTGNAASNTASNTASNARANTASPAGSNTASNTAGTAGSNTASNTASARSNTASTRSNTASAGSNTAASNTASTRATTAGRANTAEQGQTASQTAGTSGARPARRSSLPRTASSLALYELISGMAFAASFGVRRLRKR